MWYGIPHDAKIISIKYLNAAPSPNTTQFKLFEPFFLRAFMKNGSRGDQTLFPLEIRPVVSIFLAAELNSIV
jgi:hypothetical protein